MLVQYMLWPCVCVSIGVSITSWISVKTVKVFIRQTMLYVWFSDARDRDEIIMGKDTKYTWDRENL